MCIRDRDHNYVLNGVGFRPVASLVKGGLTMRVLSDMPDMHVYTANFLNSEVGRNGTRYTPHCAVCFETQYYPNSVNDPSKISCILNPGITAEHCTAFELDVYKRQPVNRLKTTTIRIHST